MFTAARDAVPINFFDVTPTGVPSSTVVGKVKIPEDATWYSTRKVVVLKNHGRSEWLGFIVADSGCDH